MGGVTYVLTQLRLVRNVGQRSMHRRLSERATVRLTGRLTWRENAITAAAVRECPAVLAGGQGEEGRVVLGRRELLGRPIAGQ